VNFLPESIQRYCDTHTANEPPLLAELARQTHLRVLYPRMLSGHYAGRVLSFVSHLVRPTCIVEVGTYTGYSALCLAEGLAPGGVLHTFDVNPETQAFARQYFDRSPWATQIVQHTGPAAQLLPPLGLRPQLAFIDADKANYLNYYNLLVPTMPTGGVILTDNVLWSGKVVDKSFQDPDTEAIRNFNTFVAQDARVEPLLLPVRDGIFALRIR
jgi:predicted O-methyltransferase YrrM